MRASQIPLASGAFVVAEADNGALLMFFPEITLLNGCIVSPKGPGTGYKVDRRKVDKYATSGHRLGG